MKYLGFNPYATSKGEYPAIRLVTLLKVYSTCGKMLSQLFC